MALSINMYCSLLSFFGGLVFLISATEPYLHSKLNTAGLPTYTSSKLLVVFSSPSTHSFSIQRRDVLSQQINVAWSFSCACLYIRTHECVCTGRKGLSGSERGYERGACGCAFLFLRVLVQLLVSGTVRHEGCGQVAFYQTQGHAQPKCHKHDTTTLSVFKVYAIGSVRCYIVTGIRN